MMKNTESVKEVLEESSDTEAAISEVTSAITQSVSVSQNAAQKAAMISMQISDVASQMQKIEEVSLQNARSVEEVAAAIDHLSSLNSSVLETMRAFKV